LKDMGAYNLDLCEFLQEWGYQTMLKSNLSKVQECFVRLYLLDAFDLASRDIGSFSDPYYVVTCGK